jgi:hypothetical protein
MTTAPTQRLCKYGCGRSAAPKNYACNVCKGRVFRGLPAIGPALKRGPKGCNVDGCTAEHYARGLCQAHQPAQVARQSGLCVCGENLEYHARCSACTLLAGDGEPHRITVDELQDYGDEQNVCGRCREIRDLRRQYGLRG